MPVNVGTRGGDTLRTLAATPCAQGKPRRAFEMLILE